MSTPRRRTVPLMLGGLAALVAGTVLELSPLWTAGMIALLAGAILALRDADRRIPRHPTSPGSRVPRIAAPSYRQGPPPPRR